MGECEFRRRTELMLLSSTKYEMHLFSDSNSRPCSHGNFVIRQVDIGPCGQ